MSTPVMIAPQNMVQNYRQIWTALNASIVVDVSDWIDCSWARTISVQVSGIVSGDVCRIDLSNSPTKPSASDNQIQYGANVTVDGVTAVTTPAAWVKVRQSAIAGGGTVSAYILLRVD
jgi:hypothetical protein